MVKSRASKARWPALVAVAAVAALGVACGSGSDDPTPTATASSGVATPTSVSTNTPPPSGGPSGTVIIGETLILPPVFLASAQASGIDFQYTAFGVAETLLRANDTEPPLVGTELGMSIAESYVVAPDQSKITFKIREGIRFNNWDDAWGDSELTAEDVAHSYNEALHTEGTVFYRAAFHGSYGEWYAEDEYTVVAPVTDGPFDPNWFGKNIIQGTSRGVPIFSKKLYDALGADGARDKAVATGPFRVTRWLSDEEVQAVAVEDHWRQTPYVQNLQILAIPEPSARLAAILNGEVDITTLPTNMLADAADGIDGLVGRTHGIPQNARIVFAGNYWAMENPVTGDAVNPDTGEPYFPRPGFDPSRPWIGDPRDAESMENARKVRTALAMAIDRELIVDRILDGYSKPAYTTFSDFSPETLGDKWNEDWVIPYDVDQAKSLLAEAGYADGFSMTFFIPLQNPIIQPETGEAVAQMWMDSLGLNLTIEKATYASRRPSMVNREINVPWLFHGSNAPRTEQQVTGNYPAAGFNPGYELPTEIATLNILNATEPDLETVIDRNIEIHNYFSEWLFSVPIVEWNRYYAVAPTVAEWTPYAIFTGDFNSPETIRMR